MAKSKGAAAVATKKQTKQADDDILDELEPVGGDEGEEEADEVEEEVDEAEEEADGEEVSDESDTSVDETLNVRSVSIDKVIPDPTAQKIRSRTEPEEMAGLAASIKRYGIHNPLLVIEDGENYRLIGGYRRLEAAKTAKLKTVPVRVLNTEAIGEGLKSEFGRKRITDDMIGQVTGIVDNMARADLPEIDILRAVAAFIEMDNGNRYKKNGKTNVQAVAKGLGVGYQWLRNRVAVLSNFTAEEIAQIDEAIQKSSGDGALTWSKIHTSLRSSGADALDAIRALVWPEKYAQAEDESDEDGAESGKSKAAEKLSEVKKAVSFDTLSENGVQVKLIGSRGSRGYNVQVTMTMPLPGSKFTGEVGDKNVTEIFKEVSNLAGVIGAIGTGKDKANAEVRAGMLAAFDAAMHALKGAIAGE